MSRLIATALRIRRDPRLLKLPPYLSLLLAVVGIAWLFLLPLDGYSRKTYISENALLPGQVRTYFSGSDQNVFRAYRNEVDTVIDRDNYDVNDKLEDVLKGIGLKVARQNYTYESSGSVYAGQNIYALLKAPRGDATEAIVLVAPWRNMQEEVNRQGVALTLTLARYFKRWSLWSKDIIFVFPPDSYLGTQAWVDAYHDSHDPSRISPLPIKSGALQGAIAVDYPQEQRFKSMHIVYDGINGQLPNLDLINSVVNIAGGQMGFGASLQGTWRTSNNYADRLRTMFRGMVTQGIGHATGAHSTFIAYHVDAVTLQPYGEGWQDEMALGRLIEGSFRSLNNLLEHLHQSFFFYLLMGKDRFVSVGTYLPSAMLLAASFTIMAVYLWVLSGQPETPAQSTKPGSAEKTSKASSVSPGRPAPAVREREMLLPLSLVVASHALGLIPLYVLNHIPASILPSVFAAFALINAALPHAASLLLTSHFAPSAQHYQLAKCFSLFLLGMFLSTLATLNFSLSFMVGVLASPLSFVPYGPRGGLIRWLWVALLNVIAPTTVWYATALLRGMDLDGLLTESALGWDISGVYTPIVIWCVWWPAWLIGSVVVLAKPVRNASG
ncbi:related to GPI-anchor transamidase GAA1 [Cephalotrichum gorgonifer]|uniref:Related to GPI-anchor transamidase GAA1 n=1 Tax=Cephalotrichum gorgonifer TaxID=2041049 RepID=A0AAE8N594_9PEZI|nr:related to GPI-anchor transamidase GAA1 [Cephalotrichum gorgonifer]